MDGLSKILYCWFNTEAKFKRQFESPAQEQDMTDLKIRRIPFAFDDVPFMWNPQNPGFSMAMNILSFYAIGFEKYICRAMQDVNR